jgi:hypothetical protein
MRGCGSNELTHWTTDGWLICWNTAAVVSIASPLRTCAPRCSVIGL